MPLGMHPNSSSSVVRKKTPRGMIDERMPVLSPSNKGLGLKKKYLQDESKVGKLFSDTKTITSMSINEEEEEESSRTTSNKAPPLRQRSSRSNLPHAPSGHSKTVPIFIDLDSFVESSYNVPKNLLNDIAKLIEARDLTPRFIATTCQRLKNEEDFIQALGKEVNDRFYRNVGTWKTKDADTGGGDSATHVADIMLYLRDHSFEFYLVLDGYDLAQEENFSEIHCMLLDNTSDVSKAQILLDKQTKNNQKKAAAAQRFTPDEWQLLKNSPLSIEVLKSDKCPLWQLQAAQNFLKKAKAERQAKKQQEFQNTHKNICPCSIS
mmetsp:Transcript_8863/g.12328  ORF Transcript_8863/g.12328 Transcript_8863/m.12328 type:complete len:321 (-) Transcript_8863:354-1316(-)